MQAKATFTQQQELFCKYYALYGGQRGAGGKSARDAGYSKKTAISVASGLLKRPEIRERIELEKKKLADRVEMASTEIIKRYQDMARRKGDYGDASVTEAERGLKQLGKYKNMQGFAEKVIIEEREPFDGWLLEELIELKRTGKVPKGKRLPDFRASRGFISRILSQKFGTGSDRPEEGQVS